MIMNRLVRLHFESTVDNFFKGLEIQNKEQLYELQKEMEDCIETVICDYCEYNNLQ